MTDLVLADVVAGDHLPPISHDVTATTVVLGAAAHRDWSPLHHDREAAIAGTGARDIFLDTPTQAAWLERCVTAWTGPRGRLGRLALRMRRPICPGDRMTLAGTVLGTRVDDVGCGWVDLELTVAVGERVATTATASVAVPVERGDNPSARRGDGWRPRTN